jgi:hypothetical protein
MPPPPPTWSALVLCDDEVLIPHAMLSCLSSTSCPYVRPQSTPQVCGCGRCPLGMVYIYINKELRALRALVSSLGRGM